MENEISLKGLTQAAMELKISSSHLRILADKKALPSTRDSAGRRLFFPADVEALRKKREQEEKQREGARNQAMTKPRRLRLRSKE